MDPPQVVVGELLGARHLERGHRAALRVERLHDLVDRAVLAGGIDALEHDEHGALGLRPEPVLELGQSLELARRLGLLPPPCPSRASPPRRAARVGAGPGRDAQGGSKIGHEPIVARRSSVEGSARRARSRDGAVPSRHHDTDRAQERPMTVATGTKPHPIFLAGRWVEFARRPRGRQPGRSRQPGRRDVQRTPRPSTRRRSTPRSTPSRSPATLPAYERGRILREISAGIKARREELGRLIALEAGKPIRDALVEVDRAVADLPPGRRGGGADDRRAHPARPDAASQGPGRDHPPLPDRADRRRSARSTSRSTSPRTSSRRRSRAGNPIVLKPPSKDPLTMLTVAEIVEAAGVPAGRGQHPADDPRARRPDGRRRALQAADLHRLTRRSAGG